MLKLIKKNPNIVSDSKTKLSDKDKAPYYVKYWTIQVSSNELPESANIILNKLEKCDCSPYISNEVDHEGKDWYRVKFGKYITHKQAKNDVIAFKNSYGMDAFVTKM